MQRWSMVLVCWLALIARFAFAADVAATDVSRVRAVIEAQLDAFASDDAEGAFSYASPGIRKTFKTPSNFIAMVKNGYPAVVRPAAVAFLQPERVDEAVVQPVHLTDRQGNVWLAVYQMERQPDGSWRIGGCHIGPARGRIV